jgi:glycine cleavage system H lipoate-binding protein
VRLVAATRLAKDAPDGLEQMLSTIARENNGIVSEEEVQSFLAEQRDRLKKLAEKNVTSERKIGTFVSSIKTLQQQIQANPEAADAKDYQEWIHELMSQENTKRGAVQLQNEKYYRDVMQELGEPVGGSQNEDDDIAVMNSTQTGTSLNCPITGTLMEDPVKNKVCGHSYSRVGITQHIRQAGRRGCQCPIAGCNNNNLSQQQIEKDSMTEMLVRRAKRRENAAKEVQASQAFAVDSDDEEA